MNCEDQLWDIEPILYQISVWVHSGGVSRGNSAYGKRRNCSPVQIYETQNVYYYYLRQEDYDYAADSISQNQSTNR